MPDANIGARGRGSTGRGIFKPGGSLGKEAFYLERPADAELLTALLQREYCHVLAPRQIGKSSLCLHAQQRLEQAGVRCATVSMMDLGGSSQAPDAWYFSLIDTLAERLKLGDPGAFWAAHAQVPCPLRLRRYLGEALRQIDADLVVFLDEIDALLPLGFREEFLGVLRAAHAARGSDERFERLTFCVLGVASTSDLARDPSGSVFTVSRPIFLEDFAPSEARPLSQGLLALPGEPQEWLAEVLRWTCGHPYLTQRLCAALLQRPAPVLPPREAVDALVREELLREGVEGDINLGYAEVYFSREEPEERVSQMLNLYLRLLSGNEEVPAQRGDPVQTALRLTGLAAERRVLPGRALLQVRNPIVAAVFNREWVHRKVLDRWLAEPLALWLASGRDEDYVLRGERLREAQRWAAARGELPRDEDEFIQASLLVESRDEAEALRERHAREEERRVLAEQHLVLEQNQRQLTEQQLRLEREHLRLAEEQLKLEQGQRRARRRLLFWGAAAVCGVLAGLTPVGLKWLRWTRLNSLSQHCVAGEDDACIRAREAFTQGCKAQDQQQCDRLALMYEGALGDKWLNQEQAVFLYDRTCAQGSVFGCFRLGYLHEKKGDFARALELYEGACEQHHYLACNNLGFLLEQGRSKVTPPPRRAFELYQLACAHNVPLGCVNEGFQYERGAVVSRDLARAKLLYGRACEEQSAEGCTSLGYLLAESDGRPDLARQHYQKGCEIKSQRACNNLGDLYEKGRLGPADLKLAVTYYMRACEGGYALGCANLAALYEKGRGVTRDVAYALVLYRAACEQRYTQACDKEQTLQRAVEPAPALTSGVGAAAQEAPSPAANIPERGAPR